LAFRGVSGEDPVLTVRKDIAEDSWTQQESSEDLPDDAWELDLVEKKGADVG